MTNEKLEGNPNAESITVLTTALEKIHEHVSNPPYGILDQLEVKRLAEDALVSARLLAQRQTWKEPTP